MQEPFLEISADLFSMPSFDTVPVGEFEFPKSDDGKEFPYCCEHHQQILANAKEWFDKFPNCCDRHLKMSKQPNFSRSNYPDIPMKVVRQVVYTEFHIQQQIHAEDWRNDICDYIEYNIKSFGHPQVGSEKYCEAIRSYIDKQKEIVPRDKARVLIDFIDREFYGGNGKAEEVSLNVLHTIYQKWLKAFPFELSFFQPLRKDFVGKLPIIDGKIHHNRYLDLAKGKALTPVRLIESLISQTKLLLGKIDSADLLHRGQISDTAQHQIDLVSKAHRIKQDALLDTYSKTEIRYVTILRNWLENEKLFFKEILPLVVAVPVPEPLPADRLKAKLLKYRFEQLDRVKVLGPAGMEGLISMIAENDLPYQMAMLSYLGFVDLLEKRSFKTRDKLFRGLSDILDAGERSVKGNYLVLNPVSKENRERYSAHTYASKVAEDYKNIK